MDYVSCLSSFLVCSLQPCGHLLADLLASLDVKFSYILSLSHRFHGSGVMLDCIDSRSLHSYGRKTRSIVCF